MRRLRASKRLPHVAGGALSDEDQLILEAATGVRSLAPDELIRVRGHVAAAGFDPARNVLAAGLTGEIWEGRILTGRDRITSAARHYLRHVVRGQEWPAGTTLAAYEESVRGLLLDPRSGVLTSRYDQQWQIGVLRRSGELRGGQGFEWTLVEYRVGVGYWVTAYQPREGLRVLLSSRRSDVRWLRRPR